MVTQGDLTIVTFYEKWQHCDLTKLEHKRIHGFHAFMEGYQWVGSSTVVAFMMSGCGLRGGKNWVEVM